MKHLKENKDLVQQYKQWQKERNLNHIKTPDKILVRSKDYEPGSEYYINEWSMDAILDEINRDHSEDFSDYIEEDWLEGWIEWEEEGDFLTILDEEGRGLNDLSEYINSLSNERPEVIEKYRKYSK